MEAHWKFKDSLFQVPRHMFPPRPIKPFTFYADLNWCDLPFKARLFTSDSNTAYFRPDLDLTIGERLEPETDPNPYLDLYDLDLTIEERLEPETDPNPYLDLYDLISYNISASVFIISWDIFKPSIYKLHAHCTSCII